MRQAQAAGNSNRIWWIVGAVILAIAVVVVVAFMAGDSDDAPGGVESASGGTVVPAGDKSVGPVEVTGTGLAALPQSGTDPAVGTPAPGLSGESFDASTVVIPEGGAPKVVMFLAHWCPHCQAEVPRIVDWLEANGLPDDVELYAVATGTSPDRPNYPPGAWLRKEEWPVPTLLDDNDQTAGNAYGLSSFPFFVVVDADGNVVQRTSGELSVPQWEALIEAARTGQASTAGGAGDASSPAG